MAERNRRKDLAAADKIVAQKASGFKKKIKRQEDAGVPQLKKNRKAKKMVSDAVTALPLCTHAAIVIIMPRM